MEFILSFFFFFYPGDGVAPLLCLKETPCTKTNLYKGKTKSPALTCFVKDTAGGFLAMCEAGTHHTHTKSIPEDEGAGEGRQHHVSTERERCGRKTHTHTHTNFRGSRCPKNVVVVERGGGEKHKAGWTYPLRERKNPFFSPSRTHHTDARTIPNLGRDRSRP